MIILNLGCGNEYLKGTSKNIKVINVDLNTDVKVDIVADLENAPFPWKDASVDKIIAKHVVEHIFKRDFFMNECFRVLKPEGTIYIETPKGGTNAYWKDPTHVSGWVPDTFRYYCDWNTCPANRRKTWEMISCEEELRGNDEILICELRKPKA